MSFIAVQLYLCMSEAARPRHWGISTGMEVRPAFALEPGKRLLWTGTQVFGRRARRRQLFAVAFFIFFTGFSVFWTYAATGFGRFAGPWWMASAGLLFIAIRIF
jgi:hypothetical protein